MRKTPISIEQKVVFSGFFSLSNYMNKAHLANVTPLDAARHFLDNWEHNRIDPSNAFVCESYLDANPDVRDSGMNPLEHYLRFGADEGRALQPARLTTSVGSRDEDELLQSLSEFSDLEVVEAISDLFDSDFYVARYPDIGDKEAAILHYVCHGWREKRDPRPDFDGVFYSSQNPVIEALGINPLLHYKLLGRENGVTPFAVALTGRKLRLDSESKIVSAADIRSMVASGFDFRPRNDSPVASRLKIHWLIPDFNGGGGGHMTIFRTIQWLELFGHECFIWIVNPEAGRTERDREDILLKYYKSVRAPMRVFDDAAKNFGADIVVATSWDTAYYCDTVENVAAKFYFVQDYEPYFYPVGARSLAAKNTYDLELNHICASPWLRNTMEQVHGRWARSFSLAADEVYQEDATRADGKRRRIAFYSRGHTARRAVELGLLALEILSQRRDDFEVHFFGGSVDFEASSFHAYDHGILNPKSLNELYNSCDVGVCFSATNYSLVPQEMMASGLAVVELNVESTVEIFPNGVVSLADPDPKNIADTIERLLDSSEVRTAQATAAREWVRSFSWERSAEQIEAAFLERLGLEKIATQPELKGGEPLVTVIIPTYNGGKIFHEVIAAVTKQRLPYLFQILVIDSGSTDGTVELCRSTPEVDLIQIEKSEFQHGRTRNLGVSQARGQYVAFLTQDAIPVGNSWLFNLVTPLERNPGAAGAFGPHEAHRNADPYTIRDLAAHFEGFRNGPLLQSIALDNVRWTNDQGWRQFLHYYSDNNSCLRKSVWQVCNLPEVDYGEDQLWAMKILELGFEKIFSPHALVSHSHDYDEIETYKRARTEAFFFKQYFGYDVSVADFVSASKSLRAADRVWGTRNGLSDDQIDRRGKLTVSRLAGLCSGAVQDGKFSSDF
ncbi:glycosyl transferase family 1 [Rhizobium sp. PP-F2F-G36]|nr:glycosyl transferase family 1 [Rhizobium sp. PP-F2F-G36]